MVGPGLNTIFKLDMISISKQLKLSLSTFECDANSKEIKFIMPTSNFKHNSNLNSLTEILLAVSQIRKIYPWPVELRLSIII